MAPLPCTEELTQQVAGLVRIGVPPETAAVASGITAEIHKSWLERSKSPGVYRNYREALAEAEAEAEVNLIRLVAEEAENGNHQAAAWLAERRWPEKYVRKSVNAPAAKTPDPGKGPADPFKALDGKVTPIRRSSGARTG